MATEFNALLSAAATFALGLLLLVSGLLKARSGKAFRGVIEAYRIVPPALAAPVAVALPAVEAVTGIALLLTGAPIAAVVAAALFLVFAIAMALNLLRGRAYIDCGCMPSSRSHPLRWRLVIRCLAYAAACLAVAHAGPMTLGWQAFLTAAPAGLAAFLFHLAIDHLWALDASRERALQRLPT